MNNKFKGVIKKAGRYTCEAARKTVRTVGKIASNPNVQKIGLMAASVAVPSVGVAVGSLAMLNSGVNQAFGRKTDMIGEMSNVLNVGSNITRGLTKGVLSPILGSVDREIKTVEDKFFR